MLPKRRFGKDEQKMKSGFSTSPLFFDNLMLPKRIFWKVGQSFQKAFFEALFNVV
jgi:hypothetical protein